METYMLNIYDDMLIACERKGWPMNAAKSN